MKKDIIKVFSIPGRIRIKVLEIYRDIDCAIRLKSIISNINGIKSIKFNVYSCSVVILYDEKTIEEINIITTLEKISFDKINFNNNDCVEIYKLDAILNGLNPFKITKNPLSRNMLYIGLLLQAYLLLTGSPLNIAVSILFLLYPGVYRVISNLAYYYAIQKLKLSNIFVSNIYKLEDVIFIKNVLLDEDLIINKNLNKNLDIHTIRRQNLLEGISFINYNVKDMVYKIRESGIKNIYILTDNGYNPLTEYAKEYLNIKDFNFNNTLDNDDLVIFKNVDFTKNIENGCFTIKVVPTIVIKHTESDILIKEDNISNVYMLFENSFLCSQYITRANSLVLAEQFFLTFLITREIFTSPILSLGINLLNIIFSDIYYKYEFLDKELIYEDKYSRIKQA